jgi:hypothetical protein
MTRARALAGIADAVVLLDFSTAGKANEKGDRSLQRRRLLVVS